MTAKSRNGEIARRPVPVQDRTKYFGLCSFGEKIEPASQRNSH